MSVASIKVVEVMWCEFVTFPHFGYRISSVNSTETDASVLVNGHFDSALNSPGASDCGSCVGKPITNKFTFILSIGLTFTD